jgi:hypothetical protein
VADAVCYLRAAFADTTILGVYGSGERRAPCSIPGQVYDRAFRSEVGDLVDVRLARCASAGIDGEIFDAWDA